MNVYTIIVFDSEIQLPIIFLLFNNYILKVTGNF